MPDSSWTAEQLSKLPPEQVPLQSALRAEGRLVGPKWPIALVAMMGALIAVLDISILNVAMPSIRVSLGASLQETSWIATGYMISNVVIIPMTGFFQKRLGYRVYFIGSIIWFTLSSALCALSWNLWSLVLFRVLQGLGGGAIIPTASSIMLDRFPRAERSMAMAVFGLGAMMGPMLGPSLGGFLVDTFSWHMIFLINLPVGIVEVFLISSFLREDRSGIGPQPVDWLGISYLIGWLASMQTVLEQGNDEGWFESAPIRWGTLFSVTCLALFVEHELRTPHPVVHLRFFRDRQYLLGTLINMGMGLSLFGGIYLFSLYSGTVLHFTASQTGHLFFFAALMQGFTMPIVGKFGSMFDRRRLLLYGITMMILSLYQYTSFNGTEGNWELLFPQLLRASGMGFVFISVGTLALDSIPSSEVGEATGLFNLTRELGGSVGTAMLATIVARRTVAHSEWLGEGLTELSSTTQARLAGLTQMMTQHFGDPTRGSEGALMMLKGTVSRQALVLAFDDAFAVATGIGLLLPIFVLLMRKPRDGAGAAGGAH